MLQDRVKSHVSSPALRPKRLLGWEVASLTSMLVVALVQAVGGGEGSTGTSAWSGL